MPYARHTDPETSHEAASTVKDVSLVKSIILAILDLGGPLSDEQILMRYYAKAESGFPRATEQSLRSRRAELVKAGLVEHNGEFAITSNGRRTRLWVLA
jgi:hypothetical protein